MSYDPALLTPYGATILRPGYWFFETSYKRMTPAVLSELHSIAPITEILEDPSRDWLMFLVRVEGAEDRLLSPELTKAIGAVFYNVKNNERTLSEIKTLVYGDFMTQPRGFLEWLSAKYPQTMNAILAGAVHVKEAGDFVSNSLQAAATIAALGFGLWVAIRLAGRK